MSERKGNIVYKLWPFLPEDYGAAGACLGELRKQGLELVRMCRWLPIAVFRERGASSGRCCGELLAEKNVAKIQDYVDLCQASGWRFLFRKNRILYFESGAQDTVPIQTSSPEEYRLGRRALLKEKMISMAIMILLFFLVWMSGNGGTFRVSGTVLFPPFVFLSYMGVAALIYLALMPCYLVYLFIGGPLRMRREERRLRAGLPLRSRSPRRAALCWWTEHLAWIGSLAAVLAACGVDLLINGDRSLLTLIGYLMFSVGGGFLGMAMRAWIAGRGEGCFEDYDCATQPQERNDRLPLGIAPYGKHTARRALLVGILALAFGVTLLFSGVLDDSSSRSDGQVKSSPFVAAYQEGLPLMAEAGGEASDGGGEGRSMGELSWYIGRGSRWASLLYDSLLRQEEAWVWSRPGEPVDRRELGCDRGMGYDDGRILYLQKGDAVLYLRLWEEQAGAGASFDEPEWRQRALRYLDLLVEEERLEVGRQVGENE